jgi:hypothetical protein
LITAPRFTDDLSDVSAFFQLRDQTVEQRAYRVAHQFVEPIGELILTGLLCSSKQFGSPFVVFVQDLGKSVARRIVRHDRSVRARGQGLHEYW